MIAFLDASALFDSTEGAEPFAIIAKSRLAELARLHPGLRLSVSRLTWLACRIRPMRENNGPVLSRYDEFFDRPDLIWVELTRDVVELVAAVRVRHGLRTPDALQAAR